MMMNTRDFLKAVFFNLSELFIKQAAASTDIGQFMFDKGFAKQISTKTSIQNQQIVFNRSKFSSVFIDLSLKQFVLFIQNPERFPLLKSESTYLCCVSG
jgi:hypothetical protein